MVLCGLWFCGGGAAGFPAGLFSFSSLSFLCVCTGKRFFVGRGGAEIFLSVVCEREGAGVWFSPEGRPGVLSAKNPPS